MPRSKGKPLSECPECGEVLQFYEKRERRFSPYGVQLDEAIDVDLNCSHCDEWEGTPPESASEDNISATYARFWRLRIHDEGGR